MADSLIPRSTSEVAPLDPAISEEYAGRVCAIRMELGRRVADVLGRSSAGTGRIAVLIDNLHLVTDAACRQWLADLFYERLETVTVVARRPATRHSARPRSRTGSATSAAPRPSTTFSGSPARRADARRIHGRNGRHTPGGSGPLRSAD